MVVRELCVPYFRLQRGLEVIFFFFFFFSLFIVAHSFLKSCFENTILVIIVKLLISPF